MLADLREEGHKVAQWCTQRLAAYIVWFAGITFIANRLVTRDPDTTTITNAAFAIFASLSALALSAARTIAEPAGVRDRLLHAGERLFHASLLALTASLIKYGYMALTAMVHSTVVEGVGYVVAVVLNVLLLVLFLISLDSAHGAVRILGDVLWSRISHHPELDR